MYKKIFYKISLLIILLLLLSTVIKWLLPFYWGDTTQATKFEYYKQHATAYNAVYLGGSLEYRHIDPAIIDSIANSNNIALKSYNLGVDGHGLVQQLHDLNGLLKIKNPNLKKVFLSVSSDAYFYLANVHTTKWNAWQNLPSTIKALRMVYSFNDGLKKKLKYTYYGMGWIENLFLVSELPDIFEYFLKKDKQDNSYLGKRKNGFYPYDYEEYHLIMEYKWQDTMLLESKKLYEAKKNIRDSLTNDITQSFNRYKGTEKANAAMVDILMAAYKKCAQRGIQVYFMLPPKARTSYDILLPVFHAMPAHTKIELADPRKYPKYYLVENGYNFHHLNYKGAKILSHDFAHQLVKVIKSDDL